MQFRTKNSPPCLGGVPAGRGGSSAESDETKMSKKLLPPNQRPHNRPYIQDRRTNLRRRLTPAEATLWKALQSSKLDGRKFRRQHSVGNYILDFYCDSERLAIELD